MSARIAEPQKWGVLVLEDDAAQRRTLSDILADEGFEPIPCATVDEAVAAAGSGAVAVAVVDERLSGESGVDFLDRVRGREPRLRTIIHTAFGSFGTVKDSLNLGAFAYVEKARDPGDLVREVHRALELTMEEALAESRRRLATIYEAANDGIVVVDPASERIVECNPRAARMLGYPREALTGMSIERIHPDQMDRVRDFVREVVSSGKGATGELSCRRAAGDAFPVEISAAAMGTGPRAHIVAVVRDASERRAAEAALRESERRLRAIFDHSPTTMTLEDLDGRRTFVNRSYERYFGGGAAGAGAGEALDGEARAELAAGRSVESEHCFQIDGEQRTLLVTRFPVTDERGDVTEIGGIGTDITERKQVQEALARSEERFQGLYDDAPDVYCTVTRAGDLSSVNRFGASYLGYRKEELVGEPFAKLVHAEDRQKVADLVEGLFGEGDAEGELEFRNIRRDGSVLWVHGRFRLGRDDTGAPSEVHVVSRDVTEAHDLSEELSYQATHDPLTALVNRRELEYRLARVIDTARRQASEHALCYLDLDQFKVINDTCGHVAGDELLRQLGELLPSQVRKRDTLARLGGDEFAVLMEHCSLMQARRVANALRRSIADFRFMWQGRSFSVGASIGLAPITEASDSVTDVLSAADTACYVAKDQGRNRIHVYHEDDVELIRRHGEMEWVSRITSALEDNRFKLYYQPIRSIDAVRAVEDVPERIEVLVRMVDEQGQIIPPGAFLPAAERYNLAVRLDQWVLGAALDWLARTPYVRDRIELCSINLSGHSLADDEFLKFVIGRLDESSVMPSRLCFEITETSAIANLTSATRFITALKGWGCRFALDDFGSGLSSFAYLKHLAVDYLKIDGVFVKDIVSDPIDLAMVRSINEIGHVMGKRTIAEFVEDEAIVEKLRDIGVDFAQGYAVGRPEPLSRLEHQEHRTGAG